MASGSERVPGTGALAPPQAPSLDWLNTADTLPVECQQLLRDLWFVPHPTQAHHYYCDKPDLRYWLVRAYVVRELGTPMICICYVCSDGYGMYHQYMFAHSGVEGIQGFLDTHGFPILAVLRIRRLKALIA